MKNEKDLTSSAIETAERDVCEMLRSLRKPDIDGCFKDIKAYIEMCENDRKVALDKVAEWNKDEEIQKLKEEIKELKTKKNKGMTFVIDEEETKAISEWIDKHIEEKHNGSRYAGAIGGRFTYRFVPTSIGEIGEVVCSCGETFCFRELV